MLSTKAMQFQRYLPQPPIAGVQVGIQQVTVEGKVVAVDPVAESLDVGYQLFFLPTQPLLAPLLLLGKDQLVQFSRFSFGLTTAFGSEY